MASTNSSIPGVGVLEASGHVGGISGGGTSLRVSKFFSSSFDDSSDEISTQSSSSKVGIPRG